MKSNLILKIVVAIIFVLAIAGFGMVLSAAKDSPEMTGATSFMVNVAFWLLIVTAVLAVVLSIFGLLKNPAALKKTLLALVVLGVLFAVSYFAADNLPVYGADGAMLDGQEGMASKWSGAGLNFSLLLLVIGGVMFVIDMLRSLIKS